ncbi:glucokinase, partial [Stenotrophomonas thermophila]
MTIAAASTVSTDSARGGLPRSLVVADVGGTFARLALAEAQPGHAPRLGSHRTYACAEHPSLAAILADFTAGLGQPVQTAVVAIAGLLDGDVLINSNLPWTVSLSATRAQSGLHELQLINDFEAVALAIPYLQPDTLVPLN